jgi:hypothetical protein
MQDSNGKEHTGADNKGQKKNYSADTTITGTGITIRTKAVKPKIRK